MNNKDKNKIQTPMGKLSPSATIIVYGFSFLFLIAMGVKSCSSDTAHEDSSNSSLKMEALAYDAVKNKLKDPDSAKFKDVAPHRSVKAGLMICGSVNSKNSFGGYGGYEGFISNGLPSATFLQSEVKDSDWPEIWNKICIN